jgi:hypothetical protein
VNKKPKWDGRSRPSDDVYRKRWNEIFGKREKTLHEELMEGFEKEQKELDESYEQSLKNKKERDDKKK